MLTKMDWADFSWCNVPKREKQNKLCIPNDHKVNQMAIKYTNIFHFNKFQNLPKLGFLVRKYTIWQP
jgi:hypothetical protein